MASRIGIRLYPLQLRAFSCRFAASKSIATIRYSSSDTSTVSAGESLAISKHKGSLRVLVPLPQQGNTYFSLHRGLTIREFVRDLRDEDEGVSNVRLFTEDGNSIAQNSVVGSIIGEPFKLMLNDRVYTLSTDEEARFRPEMDKEEMISVLDRTTAVLARVEEQQQQRNELQREIDEILAELQPLDSKRREAEEKGYSAGHRMAWVGLAFMSAQFGLMARLTWWEYSWDLMEPVTYFVGTGTAIAFMIYYVVTRNDLSPQVMAERKMLRILHKHGDKHGLNVEKYNELIYRLSDREEKLKRLI